MLIPGRYRAHLHVPIDDIDHRTCRRYILNIYIHNNNYDNGAPS